MNTARDRPPEEAAEDTSFARGLRVLLTIADRGEVRADELSALLDTPVSTIYRYLRTLTEFGFVDRTGSGYRLGSRLVIGGGTHVSTEELTRLADPVLRSLVEETGETAVLSRRIGLSAVCLLEVPSTQPLRVHLDVGAAMPLHVGAIARVLLAYAPPDVLDELLRERLPPTPHLRRKELRKELAQIAADRDRPERGRADPFHRDHRRSHHPRRRDRRGHRRHRPRVTLRSRVAGASRTLAARRGRRHRGGDRTGSEAGMTPSTVRISTQVPLAI